MTAVETLQPPIEIRKVGEVTDVSFPDRTIEMIVMPYDEPTFVEYRGRMVREIVAPGSFDGIQRRPNRVRVNYHHQDHELRHQLGTAITFHPSRKEGLVSVVRIRKNKYGDMALEAAAERGVGASAGFGVMKGGESWPDRETRRLTRLWLDHIALTPTPAYTGAHVLAVRQADPALAAPAEERTPMPNRDSFEMQMLLDREAQINARFEPRH